MFKQGTKRWSISAGAILSFVFATTGSDVVPPPGNDPPLFFVQSYGGKCLDYGPPVHEPHGFPVASGAPVYVNDCARAHPIRVEEINDRHEVILHAGAKVLGITRRPGNALASGLASGEFALELQDPADPVGGALGADRVFALDGDSIILASSRPCINTDAGGVLVAGWIRLTGGPAGPPPLCEPPPQQLVVQVQNARGANGSPLVVGPRSLSDSELWDFNPSDSGSWDFRGGGRFRGRYPTSGFKRVTTSDELWNAVCQPVPQFGHRDATDPRCKPGETSGWGHVILVEPARPEGIDLSDYPAIYLPAGITIRGDRRGLNMGPQISALHKKGEDSQDRCDACMFEIHGDYVRIAGLRLLGDNYPSGSTADLVHSTRAIDVDAADVPVVDAVRTYAPDSLPPDQHGCPAGFLYDAELDSCFACRDGGSFDVVQKSCVERIKQPSRGRSVQYIAVIDHNDISYWEEAAVHVNSHWDVRHYVTPCVRDDNASDTTDPATLDNVRVERNFLHHNERWSGGYGVNVSRAAIVGNIFLMNRHAIAAGGEPHTEYSAWYNMVLSNVPSWYPSHLRQQDFDVHGTENGTSYTGGWGGYRVDIAANTFLGGNRPNFEIRGHPCTAYYFRANISEQSSGGAIHYYGIGESDVPRVSLGSGSRPVSPVTVIPPSPNSDRNAVRLYTSNNQYRDSTIPFSNPLNRLLVGDFDGDGLQDLFLATGAAWYYSSGGKAEWRLLSAKSETAGNLLLGDFDGDGRTDVFTQMGDDWMVSWAGVSRWEAINRSQWRMSDFYIGDFVGDRRDDVFFARGDQWFVSDAGRGAFVPYAGSSFKLPDLAFGHFDVLGRYGDNEKVDVVGVVMDESGKKQWMVVYARDPEHKWRPLRSALTDTMKDLIVADFGGTGFSDIASVSPPVSDSQRRHVATKWKISRFGKDNWQDFTLIPAETPFVAIGRFDEARRNERRGVDILVWDDRPGFSIRSSGTSAPRHHSPQEMS